LRLTRDQTAGAAEADAERRTDERARLRRRTDAKTEDTARGDEQQALGTAREHAA
jgi:hypothetical protein